jgi:hypothetical protein
MIKNLKLEHVGPAPKLQIAEFGSRLNVITGDNGLGKTFLLDACWYALTRTWPDGKQFYPTADIPKNDPPRMNSTIFDKEGKEVPAQMNYNFATQTWRMQQTHLRTPGLVIYVRIDGGFSVWDPFRNYWLDQLQEISELEGGSSSSAWVAQRPMAFQFSSKQVWEGLEDDVEGQKFTFCNGFLRDVETWRLRGSGPFQLLQNVLETLSSGDESLSLGEGVRVRVSDLKDIPTLKLPYGLVPVTQAAAGMRRVLALAYLLVWAWDEHLRAARLVKEDPANQIVLLFDEVEAHLHPKWQRMFLPSILEVVNFLLVKGEAQFLVNDLLQQGSTTARALIKKQKPRTIQIVASTHAPLVLASVETVWNQLSDKLFEFKLDEGKVRFEEVLFAKHGSISNWLTSTSFGLPSEYSTSAEQAIERADAFMRQHPDSASAPTGEMEEVQRQLESALGGDDEYWPLWIPYYKRKLEMGASVT